MKFTKKLLICLMTVVATLAITIMGASACTMVYVGSDLTQDGSTFMARSEDYSNSYNKVAYVSPAGNYKQGEVYNGCYGFTYTFTHDTYAYTATSDDNFVGPGNETGKCPDCGSTHKHTPMEECGCNEMGVSVSAMVTLSANSAVKSADKMVSGGMCESDMTTILLSEAATAKEGVELLISIYDTVGAEERSGVLIGDQKEVWYVENYTGHQYIAVKLSSSMIAISPNMGAIGLVDLDDTENVIASKGIISVAKAANSYVGDEEANTIDFRASYSNTSINARMINGINYFAGEAKFDSKSITSADFTISNVKNGEIVTMYTPIVSNRVLGAKDLVDFYKVDSIANTGNLEWHIFQINSNGPMETGTVEWLAMENGAYSVAIPYYPVLTKDLYEGYKVGGLGKATTVSTVPEDATGFFPSGKSFKVLPEGWESGYYWSVDALSNYCLSSACSAEDNAMVKAKLAEMQQKCYDKQAEMAKALEGMDTEAAKTYCTAQSAALAKEAHVLTVALYKDIAFDQHVFVNGECTLCGEKDVTFNPFVDVADTAVYKDAVLWAFYKQPEQITTGFDATHFAPKASCTRAQAVTFLWRAAGCPEPTGDCPFVDVNPDSVFCKAITWAFEQGITEGFDATHFCPNATVTRAQFVTFLWRANGCPETEGSVADFVDADQIAEPYQAAVAWAVEQGITEGFEDGSFAPKAECTRWAVVLFLFRDAEEAAA